MVFNMRKPDMTSILVIGYLDLPYYEEGAWPKPIMQDARYLSSGLFLPTKNVLPSSIRLEMPSIVSVYFCAFSLHSLSSVDR